MYKLEYSTNLYNKMQNYAMFLIPKKTSLLADRIYFDVHLGNVKKNTMKVILVMDFSL